MQKISKRILAVGMPLVVVAATGVAFATWTATGSGSGAAGADSAASSLSVASATVSSADLYPGQTAGSVYVTVSSSKTYTTQFTHLNLDIGLGKAIVSSDPTNCPASNVTFHNQTFAAKTVSSSAPNTFSLGAVELSSSAPDACQGATFTIPLTVS